MSKSFRRDKRLARLVFVSALLLSLGAGLRDGVTGYVADWVESTDLPPLNPVTGVEVLARDASLLRAFQVEDGRWRLQPGQVDPMLAEMLIAWEDKRFYDHDGIDRLAALRAAWQVLRNRRVVSGASTLTMQVARLLEDGPTGTIEGKKRQIRLAMAIEQRLTKAEILDLYMRLAPYGGNIEGVRAASLAWFGHEPTRLTPTEAALLVALPQSPETRRPDRHPLAAKKARDRVLRHAVEKGLIVAGDLPALLAEPVPAAMREFPSHAPLLAERLRRAVPQQRIMTTIDPKLQKRAERLAVHAASTGPHRLSAAIVIADHRNGEILASVGTGGWAEGERAGFVDMTLALRSPGSTLKPFAYALGFDDGLIHPETLIEDSPALFGTWKPQNFDRSFRGTVTVRQALIMSLNLPVVRVTEAVGPARLVQALQRAGVELKIQGDIPGLAVVLGGAGISAEGLAQAYGALARGGRGIRLSALPDQAETLARAMFSPEAAWQTSNILAQVPPPTGGQNGRLAYKTGTSYGHRDAWAAGYDGAHVGVVWIGRPDGTPVAGAFGGDLAAPVLFEMFAGLTPVALPPPPAGIRRLNNADLPPSLQRFAKAGTVSAPKAQRADALKIAFPPDGAQIALQGRDLTAKITGGTGPYTLFLNDAPVLMGFVGDAASIPYPGAGFWQLTVIDAGGAAETAALRID